MHEYREIRAHRLLLVSIPSVLMPCHGFSELLRILLWGGFDTNFTTGRV